MSEKAVVLLSGGLDSATALAMAVAAGHNVYAMSFGYGQRHASELIAAQRVAERSRVAEHRVIEIDLRAFGASALTEDSIAVPEAPSQGVPVTYVPARNTVFLAYALAWAEVLPATAIYLGVNAVDYSGYPDCRPEFVAAFQKLADLATKAGVEGTGPRIEAPLIHLSKADIIRKGCELGVDYSLTISCYQADQTGHACGVCDSCRIRRTGFEEAGVSDPTLYR